MELVGSKDCGNSPKNRFVQEMAFALEGGLADDAGFSEDVTWETPARRMIEGRTAVLAEMEKRETALIITVEHAIAHGKVGAASGVTQLVDGSERRFSYVMEFKTAKADRVATIKSYG